MSIQRGRMAYLIHVLILNIYNHYNILRAWSSMAVSQRRKNKTKQLYNGSSTIA